MALLVIASFGVATVAHADIYDDQINQLNAQNNDASNSLNSLLSQASSFQAAIDQLNAQIAAVQAQIAANSAEQVRIQGEIVANQAQIDQKKVSIAATIKAMYLDGQTSTIEQLATSKDLSEYVDKEEYRTAVQKQLDASITEISALQEKLKQQKTEIDQLVASQKQQNDQLGAAQSEQSRLLAYNQGQQDAYNSQIAANSSHIQELRRQQIIANARFIGNAGTGPACGGGYPAKWCEIGQDTVIDDWGMYNRECVSYTAFRVAASGRHMPYWGGVGNANQWDDDARAAGIPVDTSPRVGDVAISNSGSYGHAMYVEAVNSNGTIFISQYNAALNGRFSTNTISPSGLYFIHF
ncbi:MAG: hypothetical protein JWM81_174 [Candidatus Saccharibacteria bacterium]|nr:hypothetical protein [Candidatus Saccharibacteria bacterium]